MSTTGETYRSEKGLKSGALGLVSSVAIGMASTAPAYSLAATLGLVVAGVGLQAPIIMVLAFVPMFLIAYAYKEMNAVDPDCGTTFTWAARAFGPRTGWMGGWGIIVADIIVMANLAQIAGQYGFQLVGADGLAASKWWTLLAGIVWIALMTLICYIGVEVSANMQKVLLAIEVLMLLVLAATALVRVYTGHAGSTASHVHLAWFNPFDVGSFSALTKGVLAAVFIYWGWDSAVAVNEETADRTRTPGRAAVISTVLLLVIFASVSTSAQAFAGAGDKGIGLANPNNSADVLSGLGSEVFGTHGFGWFLAKMLVFMVLTSAAASTQTTIMPTARTALSMAAHKALPDRFARVHPRFLTPTWSTVGMGLISVVFYLLLTFVSANVLTDTITSLGLAISFYYGLTAFACVWYFRRQLTRSARDLWTKGVLPLLGGLILYAFFFYAAFVVYADPSYGTGTVTLPLLGQVGRVSVLGIASLVIGLPLMEVYRRFRATYFKQGLASAPVGEQAVRAVDAVGASE
jgi:amino acid transporter